MTEPDRDFSNFVDTVSVGILQAFYRSGDKVSHEIHDATQLHRLIVNGEIGPWISYADVAAMGPYRATTDFFAALPRLFVAVDLVDPRPRIGDPL